MIVCGLKFPLLVSIFCCFLVWFKRGSAISIGNGVFCVRRTHHLNTMTTHSHFTMFFFSNTCWNRDGYTLKTHNECDRNSPNMKRWWRAVCVCVSFLLPIQLWYFTLTFDSQWLRHPFGLQFYDLVVISYCDLHRSRLLILQNSENVSPEYFHSAFYRKHDYLKCQPMNSRNHESRGNLWRSWISTRIAVRLITIWRAFFRFDCSARVICLALGVFFFASTTLILIELRDWIWSRDQQKKNGRQ